MGSVPRAQGSVCLVYPWSASQYGMRHLVNNWFIIRQQKPELHQNLPKVFHKNHLSWNLLIIIFSKYFLFFPNRFLKTHQMFFARDNFSKILHKMFLWWLFFFFDWLFISEVIQAFTTIFSGQMFLQLCLAAESYGQGCSVPILLNFTEWDCKKAGQQHLK